MRLPSTNGFSVVAIVLLTTLLSSIVAAQSGPSDGLTVVITNGKELYEASPRLRLSFDGEKTPQRTYHKLIELRNNYLKMATAALELTGSKEFTSKASATRGAQALISLAPVPDINAYCRAIDFGRVTRILPEKRLAAIRVERSRLSLDGIGKLADAMGREPLWFQSLEDLQADLDQEIARYRSAGTSAADQTAAPTAVGEKVFIRHRGGQLEATVQSFVGQDWAFVKLASNASSQDAQLSRSTRETEWPFLLSNLISQKPRPKGPDKAMASDGNGKPAKQPPRTWRDKTGRFSVQATLASLDGSMVELRKTDGKTLRVPLSRLSPEDQQYLVTFAAAADKAADSSPKARPKPASIAALTPRVSSGPRVPATELPRPRGSFQLRNFQQWSYQPSASNSTSPILGGEAKVIRLSKLPDSKVFFEEVAGLYVDDAGQHAMVVRQAGEVGGDDRFYIETVDVQSAKVTDVVELPPEVTVLAADVAKQTVYLQPNGSDGRRDPFVYIQKVVGDELEPITEWRPYSEKGDRMAIFDRVDYARLLSDDFLVTKKSHSSNLTVWRAADRQKWFEAPIKNAFAIDGRGFDGAVSADGRLMALVQPTGVALVDVATGQHVAQLPGNTGELESMAIRDDHQRLAAMTPEGIAVFDLNTGEKILEFGSASLGSRDTFTWVGNFLLVGNEYLYDVDRRILLWEYDLAFRSDETAIFKAGRLWFVDKDYKGSSKERFGRRDRFAGGFKKPRALRGLRTSRDKDPEPSAPKTRELSGGLLSIPFPHQGALDLATQLADPTRLLVLSPGDKVAIQVEVDSSAGSQEAVAKQVEANLVKAGYQPDPNSNCVLKASCVPLPKQEITIDMRPRVSRFAKEAKDFAKRTIKPYRSSLTLEIDGKQVWSRGYTAEPGGMIWMNKGENLDQALKRITTPNVKVLSETILPKYVALQGTATSRGAYGTSKVTATGNFTDQLGVPEKARK